MNVHRPTFDPKLLYTALYKGIWPAWSAKLIHREGRYSFPSLKSVSTSQYREHLQNMFLSLNQPVEKLHSDFHSWLFQDVFMSDDFPFFWEFKQIGFQRRRRKHSYCTNCTKALYSIPNQTCLQFRVVFFGPKDSNKWETMKAFFESKSQEKGQLRSKKEKMGDF